MEIITSNKASDAIARALARIASSARVRPIRTMRNFALDEIVPAVGPFANQRLTEARNPWTFRFFDEVDSGRWRRHITTGMGQGGKTLTATITPLMYHLFEHRETAILAAPLMDICSEKWRADLLPAIAASQYRDLLPSSGAGSKGGTVSSVQFKHGPILKFMSAGGDDKSRSHFTTRVVVFTELDGMDEAASSSREADAASQIEARAAAYGDRALIYGECTLSTEDGRTYREIKNGSDSRLALPCPSCHKWVTPERAHLTGWQGAADEVAVRESAKLICPSCSAPWSEPDRAQANMRARVVHKGQDIDAGGTIVGMMPRCETLGFRVSCVNNLLVTMARVAVEEWTAPRTTDGELAERKLRQFYWSLPSEAAEVTVSEMNWASITARTIDVPRGTAPSDTRKVTIGIDVGRWLCYWLAIAWRPRGTPHILEYGREECPSAIMAEELAIQNTLRRIRDEIALRGWPRVDTGEVVYPSLSLVDSGYLESPVVAFTRESGAGWLPSKGIGQSQVGRRKELIDPGYMLAPQPAGHQLVEFNSDLFKSFIHARLQTPLNEPGALTLYKAPAVEHISLAKHFTAEKKVDEFIAGRGNVIRWDRMSRNNHLLDCAAMAAAAGHGIGERLIVTVAPAPVPAPKPAQTEKSNWLVKPEGKWIR